MQTDRNREKELLRKLLANLVKMEKVPPKLEGSVLTSFCAMCEDNYEPIELMVIGRAVNQWAEEWQIKELGDDQINKIVNNLYAFKGIPPSLSK